MTDTLQSITLILNGIAIILIALALINHKREHHGN